MNFPPPPPPLPPPPPPVMLPPPPPPPPPAQSATAEEKARVRGALASAVATLEKGRCLETELEATATMAASLMKHTPDNYASVEVSSMPGGIRDAWVVISEASMKKEGETAPPFAAAAAAPVVEHAFLGTTRKEETLHLGSGQLGKSVHTSSMAGCLLWETALAQQVKDQRQQQGPSLKRALATAKSLPAYEDVWVEIFDEMLHQLHSYHARHTIPEVSKRQKFGNPATDGYDLASVAAEAIAPLQQGSLFNEEEVMGRYLDLQPIYDTSGSFLRHLARIPDEDAFALADLVAFLAKGPLCKTVAEADKLNDRKHYIRFLNSLQAYLKGFIQKVSPLLKLEQIVEPAVKDFLKEWKSKGGVDGWEAKPAEALMAESSSDEDGSTETEKPRGIGLAPFASAADLEKAVNGDELKAELSRLGLKCGGTPVDRAKRLFMTKNTPLEKLPKKLFAKKKNVDAGSLEAIALVAAKTERRIDVARREKVVMGLLDHVRPTLESTLRRLERRQAQTLNERDQELEEELHGSAIDGNKEKREKEGDDSDDESDDDPIYNPKGVPLGWDGKPIPYWLFKLHGLNHFYPCEICGNESYRGRRNFEMHFTEAKHAYGMKCLGIPNTAHFHGVTKIEDAQELWKKLQGKLDEGKFKDEEYEDSHGNVLSRAAYEDLARQGLL